MTYVITNADTPAPELWRIDGDNLNRLELSRPGPRGDERQTLDFGAPGLTIDPTDAELAELPETELRRYGLSAATLDPERA
jgi:hypothetical protein